MGVLKSRTILVTVALAALMASTVGPTRAGSRDQAPAHIHTAAGGVLIYPDITNDLWVSSLDPAMVSDGISQQVVMLIYSGLVKLNGKNQVVPDLAAAMPTISKDRLTYTFKLRPNAAFSDGTKVTAQDVVYSISRALSKAENSPSAMEYLGHIQGAAAWNSGKASSLTGIKALDGETVRIALDKPIGYFLGTLAWVNSFVVKQSLPTGANLTSGSSAQALNVGTGPFMLGKPWRYRQEMYLAPNPHWYDAAKMKLSEIDIPFVSTLDVAYREYQSGQVLMARVTSAYIASVRNRPDFHAGVRLGIDYLIPNLGQDSQCKPVSCAPFNNLHFRRALMYAINRQVITQKVLHGNETPLCSLVPKGIAGYDDADLCKLTPYDPARARAELALAKKDFGGKLPNQGNLNVIYLAAGQDYSNEYVALQQEWAAVGINVTIKGDPLQAWLDIVTKSHSAQLVEGSWGDDYPDAQDTVEELFTSGAGFNAGNYSNPTFDRLAALGDTLPPGPDRTNAYIQAQKQAINDVATIVIGQPTRFYQWKTTIHGMFVSSSFLQPQPLNEDWTKVSIQ
ncbi:MAG TPA: peptide ABC transporter substrate-binding protein [Chloroflexota bacterium]|nr:peptide ABC transporter substrate-binding protein [Chloroflexota bacterium]